MPSLTHLCVRAYLKRLPKISEPLPTALLDDMKTQLGPIVYNVVIVERRRMEADWLAEQKRKQVMRDQGA